MSEENQNENTETEAVAENTEATEAEAPEAEAAEAKAPSSAPATRRAMGDIIKEIEDEQLKTDVPEFNPGDTVVVSVKVVEGQRERLQAYEGLVIAKRNRGLNSAFTVRKISSGEGVERVFQTHSPAIAKIEVKRRGDVRRAKLYYIRSLEGRAARIKEKLAKR